MGARSQSDAQDSAPRMQSRQNITYGVYSGFCQRTSNTRLWRCPHFQSRLSKGFLKIKGFQRSPDFSQSDRREVEKSISNKKKFQKTSPKFLAGASEFLRSTSEEEGFKFQTVSVQIFSPIFSQDFSQSDPKKSSPNYFQQDFQGAHAKCISVFRSGLR